MFTSEPKGLDHSVLSTEKVHKSCRINLNVVTYPTLLFTLTGPILESRGMHTIFQKKGKILENLGKNLQNLKIFWKKTVACVRLLHAWNS